MPRVIAERVNLRLKALTTRREQPPLQGNNHYWKPLIRSDLSTKEIKDLLEQRGYATAKTMDRVWLIDSLLRCDLGQMSYVPYSNDKLRSFIAARGITTENVTTKRPITKRSRLTRSQLIQLLDNEDQNPRFEKFTSLPPEIRNRIYAMHFADFVQPILLPVQPPITLTSDHIRKETLHMFYSSCTFEVAFLRAAPQFDHIMSRVRGDRLHVPNSTLLWFLSLPAATVTSIRHLRFCLRLEPRTLRLSPYVEEYEGIMWFEVDLVRREGRGEALLYFAQAPLPHWMGPPSKKRDAIRDAVQEINDSSRNGKIRITTDDIRALRRAMEIA